MSSLMRREDERERVTMLNVLTFVARFGFPFLIGFLYGMLSPWR